MSHEELAAEVLEGGTRYNCKVYLSLFLCIQQTDVVV